MEQWGKEDVGIDLVFYSERKRICAKILVLRCLLTITGTMFTRYFVFILLQLRSALELLRSLFCSVFTDGTEGKIRRTMRIWFAARTGMKWWTSSWIIRLHKMCLKKTIYNDLENRVTRVNRIASLRPWERTFSWGKRPLSSADAETSWQPRIQSTMSPQPAPW